jgi:hypothetical protein
MDPFGFSPEQHSAAAEWTSVVVLVVTAYLVLGQLREAQRLRHEQSRPFVIVRWEIQRFLILILIENIGQTVAREIRVSFSEPLASKAFSDTDFSEVSLLSEGIPSLAPSQQLMFYFDVSHQRIDSDLPLTYHGSAKYSDGRGSHYGPEDFVLDLKSFIDTALQPKGMPELVSAVEDLRKEVGKWTEGIKGLRVYTVDRVRDSAEQARPYRIQLAKKVLREEGALALIRHVIRTYQDRHGWYERGTR